MQRFLKMKGIARDAGCSRANVVKAMAALKIASASDMTVERQDAAEF